MPTPAVDFIIIIVKGIYSESTEKSQTTCTFEIIDTLGVTDNYSKDTMPMEQKFINLNYIDTCLLVR